MRTEFENDSPVSSSPREMVEEADREHPYWALLT